MNTITFDELHSNDMHSELAKLSIQETEEVNGGIFMLLLAKPFLMLDSTGPGGSWYGNAANDSYNAGFGYAIGMKF